MSNATKEDLIAFENRIVSLWEAGDLPFLIHLSGGNEDHLISLFSDIQPGDWILSSHRNHYHYLLAGGSPKRLEQLIRHGNSMFVFDSSLNFLTSAILGGTCGIAVGIALGLRLSKSPASVWCFLGDGAEDNGHLYEASRCAESLELPVRFVVEDNDRSVTATRPQRGSGYTPVWPPCVIRYTYTSTYPHAGSGCKHKITFKLIKP